MEHAKCEGSVGYEAEVDSRSTQGSKSGSQLRTTDENIALIYIREPVQPYFQHCCCWLCFYYPVRKSK